MVDIKVWWKKGESCWNSLISHARLTEGAALRVRDPEVAESDPAAGMDFSGSRLDFSGRSLAVLQPRAPPPPPPSPADDVIISHRHLGATAAIRRHRSQPIVNSRAPSLPGLLFTESPDKLGLRVTFSHAALPLTGFHVLAYKSIF
ncbi:unnamed protein product [Scomber scombrus]|uniref:Unnamed protein product n=1 Tax=Scomber scombrus TaxID=13677 RepID=A0AAV1PHM4_SCOSC